MKRKLISFILICAFIIPSMFMLSACKKQPEDLKVMNVDLNPSLEFVLDNDNKVITVNATNDEGNFVIVKADNNGVSGFVGLSATDAVKKFVDIAKQYGFIIEGQVDQNENNIKVSFSGDYNNIYDDIKSSIDSYLQETDFNVSFTLLDSLNADYLKEQIYEARLDIDAEDLKDMPVESLEQILLDCRKETQNLHTEELKDMYYFESYLARLRTEMNASLHLVEQYMNENNGDLSLLNQVLYEGMQTATEEITILLDSFDETYRSLYTAVESEYKTIQSNYLTKKKQLLEGRLNGNLTETQLGQIEYAISYLDAQMLALEEQHDNTLLAVVNAVDLAMESVRALVTALEINLTELQTLAAGELSTFKSEFNMAHEDLINENFWNRLTPTIPAE